MREFAERTRKNAQAKLAQEQAERQNRAMEQQVKEREKALKAKDYARKQREIIKQQTDAKKASSQEPVPAMQVRKTEVAAEVIQEVPEELNESSRIVPKAV